LEHRKIESCASELFISGGGGGDLEDIKKDDKEMKFGASEFGFLELELTEKVLTVRFFNKEAKRIYMKVLYNF
jgi:hypothetical protein